MKIALKKISSSFHPTMTLIVFYFFGLFGPSLSRSMTPNRTPSLVKPIYNYQDLQSKVQKALELHVRSTDSPIYNASVSISSPTRNLHAEAAFGYADGLQIPMQPHFAYRIASESKMLTAVLILQLAEQKRIAVDDPAWIHLKRAVEWDRLHIFKGRSFGRFITIRQLLNHSSGLADYIFDDANFLPNVIQVKNRQWNPDQIFSSYFNADLNLNPYFVPGADHHYSDTNYVLLAMIVEDVYGRPFAEVLRQKIFEPTGMNESFLEWYESKISNIYLTHSFYSQLDITNHNTSFDWGGGGIVSTHRDMTLFLRGLFAGKLFHSPETLMTMIDWKNSTSPTKKHYAYGIARLSLERFNFIGHTGAYGSLIVFDPDKDLSISICLNQAQHSNEVGLLKTITELIDRELDSIESN